MARGNLATLEASFDDLYDGEIVYALDEQALYCKDGGSLIPMAGTSVLSVNGQTGNVQIGVEELNDVFGTPATGDTLVYTNGAWEFVPAQGVGSVLEVDAEGANGITAAGGPITSSGTFTITLDDTPITPGEYSSPVLSVDQQGRITAIESGAIPPITLDAIVDVDAPGPGIGDVLAWDGTNWVNSDAYLNGGGGSSDVQSINDLTDVDTETNEPSDGQVLTYDADSATWVPGIGGGGGGGGANLINDLLDVSTVAPSNEQILTYNQSSGRWENNTNRLPTFDRIDEATINNPQNGDVLAWDSVAEKWVNGPPGASGPITLETYQTDAAGSPLIGGEANLPDVAAWQALGFVTFPLTGAYTDYVYRQIDLNGLNCAMHNAILFGGLTSNQPKVVVGNNRAMIGTSTFLTLGRAGNTSALYPAWNPNLVDEFNIQTNISANASLEISILTEDIWFKSMELLQAGVIPRYTDEKGEDWTIFRGEYYRFDDSSKTFAREVWISENGSVWVKQGQQTWNDPWEPQYPGLHGIAVPGGGLNPPTGFGDGVWVGLEENIASYCYGIAAVEQPPAPPPIKFDQLTDVTFSNLQNGDIAVYNSATAEWANTPIPDTDLGNKSIDEMGDVDTSTDLPTDGDSLVWNAQASQWVPYRPLDDVFIPEGLDDLDDVIIDSPPVFGQLLGYNGLSWVPVQPPITGAQELSDLNDVNTNSPIPVDGQSLVYDQSSDKWNAGNPRATEGAPDENPFPGKPGEMRFTSEYFYVCIAPDTWKKTPLYGLDETPGPGPGPGPDPELGDIADGGDFTDGTEGTIDTVLDGGNWTTGQTGDQEDVTMDGGNFSDYAIPGPDDKIDGGDFEQGGSTGTEFIMDAGNWTTGDIEGGANTLVDGGLWTDPENPDLYNPANGGNFTTGAPGIQAEVVDGGNWTYGYVVDDTPAEGGDFTTGESGDVDELLDGGQFKPSAP